jgi:heme exporter protein C
LPAGRKDSIAAQAISSIVVSFLIGCAIYGALIWAPSEKTMGFLQRIFYFHVACANAALFAYSIVFVANMGYLLRRKPEWDWLATAGVEVGLIFTTIALVTGSIWAKPAWGVWWVWDARTTSTLALWLLYVVYPLLRGLVDNPERRAVISAVFGAFAFLDVPLVYFSIWWWRTEHPPPIVFKTGKLNGDMYKALLMSFIALAAMMVLMIWRRYKLESLRYAVEELRIEAEYQNEGGAK